MTPAGADGPAIDNLSSLLFEHPFGAGEPLLCTADRTVSAGEAKAGALAVAEALGGLGVAAGQAVAVQLPNGPPVVEAMMGIWRAGAVFVPVNPRLPPRQLDRLLGPTAPAALVDSDGLRALDTPRTYEPGTAFIMWTSGTTGAPKPIVHGHRTYVELLDRMLGPLRGTRREIQHRPSPNLVPVSLALNAGIYQVLFGLRAGAALVIMEAFDNATFAELVERFQIRSTVLPPAAIAMLNDDPAVNTLAPLKYVRSITAPLSPLQARRFTERYGAFVLNSYGQAELGEVIGWTAGDAKEHPEKLGAAGRPHAGVAIKIVDEHDEDRPVPTGQVGHLRVRPPNMAVGYASGDSLDERLDAEGFLATGDLARLDEEGFVWIEGRAGDLINRGGNKVFPAEVEEVLCLSPTVREAAVVAGPDRRLGEVPVAFVVPDGVPEPDPAELEALCRAHLVPYKVPVRYLRLHRLPRNETGKVLRGELAARLLREH